MAVVGVIVVVMGFDLWCTPSRRYQGGSDAFRGDLKMSCELMKSAEGPVAPENDLLLATAIDYVRNGFAANSLSR